MLTSSARLLRANAARALLLVFCLLCTELAQAAEEFNLSGLYQQSGFQEFRSYDDGARSVDSIDPFSGRLQLTQTDAVIPGTGGFSLPIIRYYSSTQIRSSAYSIQLQPSEEILFGYGWNLHFGRIREGALTQTYCAGTLDRDDTQDSPMFEMPGGQRHIMYKTTGQNPSESDLTTLANHRITCNADRTVVVETSSGVTYKFDKQAGFAGPGDEGIVASGGWMYVTQIIDPNGNSFEFEYSLRRRWLTIDSVKINDTGREVASFTYGSNTSGYSDDRKNIEANLVLRQISTTGKTVRYDYFDSLTQAPTVAIHQLQKVVDGTTKGLVWQYSYYPAASQDPDAHNLETLTNTYSGKTSFTYQYLKRSSGSIAAIKTRKQTGLGTWTYDYVLDDSGSNGGYDDVTINAPEGKTYELRHCGASELSDNCQFLEGRLVERKTIDRSTGGLGQRVLQTERFDWRVLEIISNQADIKRGFGLQPYTRGPVWSVVLAQSSIEQQGLYHTNQYYNFDTYANPRTVIESYGTQLPGYTESIAVDSGQPSSGIGNSSSERRTDYEYEHKSDDTWRLGLISSVKVEDTSEFHGGVENKYVFDSKGNLASETVYGQKMDYERDNKGNAIKVTMPAGNRIKLTDYVLGTPQVETREVESNNVFQNYRTRSVNRATGQIANESVAVTNSSNRTTVFEYDAIGRVRAIITPRPDLEDDNVSIVWDRASKKETTTRGSSVSVKTIGKFGDIDKMTTVGVADPENPGAGTTAVIVDRSFDAYGRTTFQSFPHAGATGDELKGRTFEYDALDRLVRIKSSEDSALTEFKYNRNTVEATDRLLNKTTYEYRSFGNLAEKQLMKVTQPENATTVYKRGKLGHILNVTQLSGGVAQDQVRSYQYNNLYRVESSSNPDSGTTTFTYYDDGQHKTVTSATGAETTHMYDAGRRLQSVDYPNTSSVASSLTNTDVSYAYYLNDEIRSVSKGGTEWAYSYDLNGNVKNETATVNRIGYKFMHAYDKADALSQTTYPDGSVVRYAPDGLQRPTRVGTYVDEVVYHPTGIAEYFSFGNGNSRSIELDNSQRPERLAVSNGSTDVMLQTSSYDATGNAVDMTLSTVVGAQTFQNTYAHSYDGLNRLTNTQFNGRSYDYQYDVFGNLTKLSIPEKGLSDITLYLSDFNRRLEFVTGLPNDDVRGYEFDALGNVRSDWQKSYLFDDALQLRSVGEFDSSVVFAEFQYDGHGRRVMSEHDGAETVSLYTLDGKLRYESIPSKGKTTQYHYLGNTLVARMDDTVVLGEDDDSDGDGMNDAFEGIEDLDADGVANYLDADSDGDGLSDLEEGDVDTDGDGIIDAYDRESDGNGILDIDEKYLDHEHCLENMAYSHDTGRVMVTAGVGETTPVVYGMREYYGPDEDLDGDDIPNELDEDIDGDGASNDYERGFSPSDVDCDGYPNWYDTDSDDDDYYDGDEHQLGVNSDIDGDGTPNFLDLDSNNSGKPDSLEPPTEYGNLFLQYTAPKRIVNGDANVSGAVVSREVVEAFNGLKDKVLVHFPDDVDPTGQEDFAIEFRAAGGSEPDLTGEWSYFGEGDPIDGTPGVDCRQAGPPYLSNSAFPTGYVGGINPITLPYCRFGKYPAAEPEFLPYRYSIDISTYGASVQGKAIVFEVSRAASSNTAGKLTYLREYEGDFVDVNTKVVVEFNGISVQYVRDPGYVPSYPYVQRIRVTTGSGSTVLGVYTTCCISTPGFEGDRTSVKNMYSDMDSAGIAAINRVGVQVSFNTHYFVEDRLPEERLGLMLRGVGDTTESYRFVLTNPLDLPFDYQNLPTRWFLFEITGTASPDSPGTLLYKRVYEEALDVFDASVGALGFRKLSDSGDVALGPDTDGDGIADIIEMGTVSAPVDSDFDGTPDYKDLDSDNDGISDSVEAAVNYLDPPDTDGLGAPDYRDLDSDNDGIPDSVETSADPDKDGRPNYMDIDSDGDFITDEIEFRSAGGDVAADLDQDGIPDFVDDDSDNDSIPDHIEAAGSYQSPVDTDNDGLPDYLDLDSDNDGVSDEDESVLSADADNDGIPDNVELSEGLNPDDPDDALLDLDDDGLSNLQEYQAGTAISSPDTDSDTIPDGFEVAAGTNPLSSDAGEDLDGDGLSNLEEFQSPLTVGNVVYRINVGGPSIGGVRPWSDDPGQVSQYGSGGAPGTTQQTIGLDIEAGLFSPPQGMFSTFRETEAANTDMIWHLPVADSAYEIRLYFAETDTSVTSAGVRLMQLAIEESVIDDTLDIYALASGNTGTVRSVVANVENGLDLVLSASPGRPVLSGIEVIVADPSRVDPVDPPTDFVSPAVVTNVNDWFNPAWGGGHIVRFEYPLTTVEVPSTGDIAWRIETNYTGEGTITNAWANGYGGSTYHGPLAADGGFGLSNENENYKAELSAGSVLGFSVEVDGVGFNENDFNPRFFNLDETVEGPDIDPESPEENFPDHAGFGQLESWYNPEWGGGYNIIITYEIQPEDIVDESDKGWSVEIRYTGEGSIATGWVEGFGGGVTVEVPTQDTVTYSNEQISWQPEIHAGDVLNLAVQIEGAPFSESDFTIEFRQ